MTATTEFGLAQPVRRVDGVISLRHATHSGTSLGRNGLGAARGVGQWAAP